MIPLLRRLLRSLLWDELSAVRWIRGLMMAMATGGLAFAEQLAGVLSAPGAIRTIKAVAIICGLVAGMTTAGEKNPPSETKP